MSAKKKPNQPPQSQPSMQARAQTKRKRKHRRRKSQPLPQPLQAQAKAETSRSGQKPRPFQGQQPQPPQPPLGKTKSQGQQPQPSQPSAGYVDKAARRRAKRLRRKARRLENSEDADTPELDGNSAVSTLKRSVEDVEYNQVNINTLTKRPRKDSPSGTDIIQYEQDKYDSDKESSHNSIKGVLTIKEGSDSLR